MRERGKFGTNYASAERRLAIPATRCPVDRLWAVRLLVLTQALILISTASLAGKSRPTQNTGVVKSEQHASQAAGYVGAKVCASCHTSEAASQVQTRMAHAGMIPADSKFLRSHPDMAVHMGSYVYRVQLQGDRAIYSVSGGGKTASVPLLYAFGDGMVGQTFVFERNGTYYESRVSFYTALKGLGLTMGHSRAAPSSIEAALGRRMEPSEARACFSCHLTGAVADGQLHLQQSVPGVTCEHCHGPGARHVAAVKAGNFKQSFISNPARLSPEDSIRFCGKCHRTVDDVLTLGTTGVLTVRFQPYRLVLSHCWNPNDSRLTCITCHDPHQEVRSDASFYDSKCLACHLQRPATKTTAANPGKACPVGDHDCVTCHMPKKELPGSHTLFTDHTIQIVQHTAPVPDEIPPASQHP